jgi:hypothetical protein
MIQGAFLRSVLVPGEVLRDSWRRRWKIGRGTALRRSSRTRSEAATSFFYMWHCTAGWLRLWRFRLDC